ncbi:succinate dehydrogenase, hydrophobic membrane anchor protein [Rhizorhapis sp. SPR117]|uniref:succinate dehydrogenase, hydrophobic membrane anchor protein n=1 Tax=Rhizorhapis sp. SPR117 TaxID=2912611 RepID=UPI001EFF9995|nr:succinate dehydrogenase, hydrophobic membrane anchor protein [Rhizorhapis sp. SPR117]
MGTGTGLGRVRGLGSARAGSHHWINQRITAVGNLILVPWLIFSVMRLPGLEYAQVTAWVAEPLVAVPLMLMLISIFYHLRLGLQVMIEDYVHDDALKFGAILLLNFYAIGGAALGLFAVAKIAFSGATA